MAGEVDRLMHGTQQQGVRWANIGSAALALYIVAKHETCFHFSGFFVKLHFPLYNLKLRFIASIQ